MHARYAYLQADHFEACLPLAALLALLAASAASALAWMAPSLWIRPLALVALTAGMWMSVRRHVLRRGPRAVRGLRLEEDGGVSVRLAATQDWQPADVTHVWVGRWIVVLRLSLPGGGGKAPLCLTRDALDGTRWRQLRAALRQRFPDC